MRERCLIRQCGARDAWILTAGRPLVGVLGCSTCGDDETAFHYADRHTGDDGSPSCNPISEDNGPIRRRGMRWSSLWAL